MKTCLITRMLITWWVAVFMLPGVSWAGPAVSKAVVPGVSADVRSLPVVQPGAKERPARRILRQVPNPAGNVSAMAARTDPLLAVSPGLAAEENSPAPLISFKA